jgi:two-component system, OmpR family, response regulator
MPAHILVVDDEREIRDVLREGLAAAGYRVTCADDGTEVRQVLATETVDLLVADVVLAGERGSSLAEFAHTKDIPVILMSGEPRAMEQLSALPHAHLRKPFRLTELLELVESLVGSGTAGESIDTQ